VGPIGSGHDGLGHQIGAPPRRLEVAAAGDDMRVGKRRDAGEVLIADLLSGGA